MVVGMNVLENVYNVSLIFYFLLLGYIIFFLKKINVLNFNLSMLVGFYFMIFNYEQKILKVKIYFFILLYRMYMYEWFFVILNILVLKCI